MEYVESIFITRNNIKLINELGETNLEEKDFYKFAVLLGCFSNQRLIDKHGKETLIIMAQKASSFLAHIVKNKLIDIERLDRIVKDIPLGFEPSQDFFISTSVSFNSFLKNLKSL